MIETSVQEAGFIVAIKLEPTHIVYLGHFPGHPVTPGVVQLQIVHELIEEQFSQQIKLISIARCKFLKVLDPNEISQVVVHVEFSSVGKLLNIKARIENNVGIFFKLNSVYQFI